MALKRSAYDPYEQYELGFPLTVQLVKPGTLAAAGGTLVSAAKLAFLQPCKGTKVASLAGFTAAVTNNGSTSGSTTVGLYVNGTIVGTVSLPYGAGVVSGAADLRGPTGAGLQISDGDVLAVDISSVPGGGSATDLIVVVYLRAYDVKA